MCFECVSPEALQPVFRTISTNPVVNILSIAIEHQQLPSWCWDSVLRRCGVIQTGYTLNIVCEILAFDSKPISCIQTAV